HLDTGAFSFNTDPSVLQDIANGKAGVDIATFHPSEFTLADLPFDLTFPPDGAPPIPIVSILDIINLTFNVGVHFDFKGTADLGMGLDTPGFFVDTETNPNPAKVAFSATIGVFGELGVTIAQLPAKFIAVDFGPDFTTTLTLGINNNFNGTD